MKVYANSPDDGTMIVPSGEKFPGNPKYAQLFRLTKDQPVTNTADRWYGAGTYIYDYGIWTRLNESGRQRRAADVPSQTVSVDELLLRPREAPMPNAGHLLSTVIMNPVNRASTYSGMATLWVETEVDCQVALTVFRDNRQLVGMSVEAVQKGKPRNITVSFYDLPFTGVTTPQHLQAIYALRINSDANGTLFVNRGNRQFVFDDVAVKTAFLVSECS